MQSEQRHCGCDPEEMKADASYQYFDAEDLFWGFDGKFRYRMCQNCLSWQIVSTPTSSVLAHHYSGYYPSREFELRRKNPISAIERQRAKQVVKTIKSVSEPPPRWRVLDVGAGCGGFLAALRDIQDCKPVACDNHDGCKRFATELLKIPFFQGEISEIPIDEDGFDLITMWHCFEHVTDPTLTLKAAHSRLTRDGILMIEVPTPTRMARRFKSNWFFLQAPTHLNLFSPLHLTRLLALCGFSVKAIERPWSPTEWAGSVLFRLGFRGFMPHVFFSPSTWRHHLWRLLFFVLLPVDLLITLITFTRGDAGVLRIFAEKQKTTSE